MVETATAAHAHQFDKPEQQREAAALGMWLFLATEIMFFGGMFTGYTVYRSMYPQGFAEASRHMGGVLATVMLAGRRVEVTLGAVNTAVLLLSSLTMALAVHSVQTGAKVRSIVHLAGTALMGCVFLAIKAVEYAHKFHEGLVPGAAFRFEGVHAGSVELFFGFYFAMTGFHAVHLLVGIGVVVAMLLMVANGRISAAYDTPVEMTGLYWHFVDIVWVFLFPLLYLIAG